MTYMRTRAPMGYLDEEWVGIVNGGGENTLHPLSRDKPAV